MVFFLLFFKHFIDWNWGCTWVWIWKLKSNTKLNLSTAALPGQTTKTALTEEFMFQNVAYRPTVYITGVFSRSFIMIQVNILPVNSILGHFKGLSLNNWDFLDYKYKHNGPTGRYLTASCIVKKRLSWIELSWAELSWAELGWIELNWAELGWIVLNWAEFCWVELVRAELSWI